jgi:DNA primase
MLKQEVIEAVRERTDIVKLIGETVRLTKKGATWRGCCPFHKEKTPSFHVNPVRAYFHCFGCKESGSPIDFVMKTDGLSFTDAVKLLAERLNIEVEETRTPAERQEANAAKGQKESCYRANEIAAQWFEMALWSGPIPAGIPADCHPERTLQQRPVGVENAWAELGKRGLAPTNGSEKLIGDTLRAFRIGYAPAGWDGLMKHLVAMGISPIVGEQAGLIVPRQGSNSFYDRFRNRLMFAVTDVQGRVVGFSGRALPVPTGGDAGDWKEAAKYMNTPESRVYTKGQQLFGLWQAKGEIRRRDSAVLVEGNFDVVSLHARGLGHVVAPLGTAFTADQAVLLKRFGTRVIVAFDGDAAGVKATASSRDSCAIAALSARVATLPASSDPDAFVRDKGVAVFERLLETSSGIIEWLIDQALDPSTFGRAPLQEQLDRVRMVGDVLAGEKDPDMHRLAATYANRAASRLGITASSSITMEQLHRVIAQKLRTGENDNGPAAPPTRDGPDYAIQEAILGALLDVPDMLSEEGYLEWVENVFDGDFALALGQLLQHGATPLMLAGLADGLHAFVAGRLVAPLHDTGEATDVVRANVQKLLEMRKQSRVDDLLAELDTAMASGDDDEIMRVMTELDTLNRRR